MRRFSLFLFALLVAFACSVSAASASPGALRVLVTGNCCGTEGDVATAIAGLPGVAAADSFETSDATPTAEQLAPIDVVVSTGDTTYDDAALWGDRLADFVDAGGVVVQAAYDNWDEPNASPQGRFASGGYAPLLLGPNDNIPTQLGEILQPASPLLADVGPFPAPDNTTTALAPGATLIAKWADGRNAIASKGRVVATSASPGRPETVPPVARLAVNAGNFMGRHPLTVTKTGEGTVSSTPAGIACGADCTEPVAFGESVALTATPSAGSKFVGWTGACTGTGPCTVTNNGGPINVEADFAATFGSKSKVKVTAGNKRVGGSLALKITNKNPFAVTGKVGAKLAGVKLKPKKFKVKANGKASVKLKLDPKTRQALADAGKAKVKVKGKVVDPAGASRKLKGGFTVKPQ